MSDDATRRSYLHEAIQEAPAPSEDDLEGAVLMGWVMISEWMDPAGAKWLATDDGGVMDRSLPSWQVNGYLHDTLFNPPETVERPDE